METATAIANEIPTVGFAARTTTGRTMSACNGRMTFGAGSGTADEITCKRCRKLVTA